MTPEEPEQYPFPAVDQRSSDEDGTLRDGSDSPTGKPHLPHLEVTGALHVDQGSRSPLSAVEKRMQEQMLDDDLEMLRAERVASATTDNKSEGRSRTRAEPIDDFDVGTTPIFEKAKIYQPPEHPDTNFAKIFKRIHQSSFLVRYLFYIMPLTIILLIPLLLGALVFPNASVGGVKMMWFMVWLEIVWLTLWAGRILAKCIPWPMGLLASTFTNNNKKWRDLGKALEVPATLFFWWLAIEISFLPTMTHHHLDGSTGTKGWEVTMNKVLVAIFVGTVLNFIEKIIIQLIAISFHLRTYQDRIEVNKFQIGSLTKLYSYSKNKIAMEDYEFEIRDADAGTRTPMAMLKNAQDVAKSAITKVGDVAGKVAGDFTGRIVNDSHHPHQVILTLLSTTNGSQVLARRLYRTFAVDGHDTVSSDDLRAAFDNNDEADAAFTMFDKDLNGDISMEELEAVCVEIGRERKAITASLKDLDSVVSKLDEVFFFVVLLITLLVLISLISTSAAGVLTSLGSTVLALSWLFSVTAQEFLQSIIFVFVKHPFDVGDRVKIYGNTGSTMQGDDYFVKEISLLYTEFKKMEGHVVQAPNSYLNTLFILNQRRSGGLAEAVTIVIKFGTTLEQIETLRSRLLEFVTSEKREYQTNILTELTTITEAYKISLNIVFFYKSNWQNELLRLQRRNKFICAMMVTMQELGIEGPYRILPGAQPDNPFHLANPLGEMPTHASHSRDDPSPVVGPGPRTGSLARDHSSIRSRARTGSSAAEMRKRVDFSLGMSGISSGVENFGDSFEDRRPVLPPTLTQTAPTPDNGSLARITSRESSQPRDSADVDSRSRRGRFFRKMRSSTDDDAVRMDDLEAGTTGSVMADIPESGVATRHASFETGRSVLSGAPSHPHPHFHPHAHFGGPRRAATEMS